MSLQGRMLRLAKRTAFRLGYPLARAWWWAVPQSAEGVATALTIPGQVLVVRQSFRAGLGLIGGGLPAGERPEDGAVREIREEIGLAVDPERLRSCGVLALVHESRSLRVHLFEVAFSEPPPIRPDGAEVVGAEWMEPASLDGRADLHPVLAHWLSMRRPRAAGDAAGQPT